MEQKNTKLIKKYTTEYFTYSFAIKEFKSSNLYKLNKNNIKNIGDMINVIVSETIQFKEWEKSNTFYNKCINVIM